jgi:hypothetical protein
MNNIKELVLKELLAKLELHSALIEGEMVYKDCIKFIQDEIFKENPRMTEMRFGGALDIMPQATAMLPHVLCEAERQTREYFSDEKSGVSI